MKNILNVLVFLLIPLSLYSQDIITGEYFFNTDPGYGNGNEITFTANDTLEFEINIPFIEDLPIGANKLFFRFKNENNIWSHNYSRLVLNEGNVKASQQIQEVKYYFDTVNLANEHRLNFEDDSIKVSIDTTMDLSNLENGVHYLYLQATNKNNSQSLLTRRFVLVSPESAENEIESISYTISSNDILTQPVVYSFQNPSPIVSEDIFINTFDFVEDTTYTLTAIAIDKGGSKSFNAFTDFVYHINNAPYAKKEIVSFISYVDSTLEISMDTLFSDNDLPDDSLMFSTQDYGNTGILNVTQWKNEKTLVVNPGSTELGNHSIQLFAQDLFGDKDSIMIKLIVDKVTSIPTNGVSFKYFLYPNPANDYLTILDNGIKTDVLLIEFYNTFGQKVKSITKSGLIGISDLDEGIYFLIIKNSGFKQVEKLIINR